MKQYIGIINIHISVKQYMTLKAVQPDDTGKRAGIISALPSFPSAFPACASGYKAICFKICSKMINI